MISELTGPAQQFNDKIESIKSQFFAALDDYKKYYVYFNKNPEVNEFQNYYANSKGQLQNLSKDIFVTTNNIDKNIETLDTQIKGTAVKLEQEKELNGKLVKLLADLEGTHESSEILIDDSKMEYNTKYYNIIQIAIGIIILILLILFLFRTKIQETIKNTKTPFTPKLIEPISK
jgi:hypothetical protein